ncbi:MAG TPA: DUF5069 domain-containing protein, partial [Candidatus Saccharimonadia bacterium]|nr:DUF5069 domain-containing protein [Candidatus Saccharimonadia bacterium]
MMPYPRSAYDRTKGLVYFARMLDKIRLQAKGELREDYFENLGGGFDGRCCRLLGISYDVLKERVLAGGTDEEVLDWIYTQRAPLTEEQLLVWNKFMEKRGWRDEDDGSTQELESYKAGSGLG